MREINKSNLPFRNTTDFQNGATDYLIKERMTPEGFTATKGGQIPAIALTAYAGELNHQQAIAAGFQPHLSKPVDSEMLVRAIV